ncbi:hypothetical protein [Planctomonas deserti]|uniref:hypothetical protein n=1 Tax=Planctomonas deserti TaxID=2144185 RepID=UPI00197BBBFF|nr:hypothetical protein [Planctomonas deserti]
MSEIDPEYVKHQYLYVPWTDKFDSFGVGKALARHVANHFRARLTVVCPQKSNAQWHDELAKLPIVTERTGTVVDGGVVLAFVPTRKVMAKVHHLSESIVIMVEDPSERFEAWARLVGAYNVLTRKVMSSGLSEAGTKALDGVVWEGYNGWHDSIAETMTIKHLRDLAESDGYDRAIVLEYVAQRKGEYALKRLEKILDTFERSVPAVA